MNVLFSKESVKTDMHREEKEIFQSANKYLISIGYYLITQRRRKLKGEKMSFFY
jgi:hypothetical protein